MTWEDIEWIELSYSTTLAEDNKYPLKAMFKGMLAPGHYSRYKAVYGRTIEETLQVYPKPPYQMALKFLMPEMQHWIENLEEYLAEKILSAMVLAYNRGMIEGAKIGRTDEALERDLNQ